MALLKVSEDDFHLKRVTYRVLRKPDQHPRTQSLNSYRNILKPATEYGKIKTTAEDTVKTTLASPAARLNHAGISLDSAFDHMQSYGIRPFNFTLLKSTATRRFFISFVASVSAGEH